MGNANVIGQFQARILGFLNKFLQFLTPVG
jgi:hypothetical protein